MNTEYLTTPEAARRARVSRPTISRALKCGDLPAIRDNGGRWMIAPTDVDSWAENRANVHSVQRSHSVQNAPQPLDDERYEQLRTDLATSRETVARLEGEAAMNERRITDLSADRDKWREMAERLSHRQTTLQDAHPRSVSGTRASLWTRIFGR